MRYHRDSQLLKEGDIFLWLRHLEILLGNERYHSSCQIEKSRKIIFKIHFISHLFLSLKW